MRIEKLELVGFKSFKDRTVIHFDAGITGIVGPNGCGKSNIVDALVWVMGEMSAKHLRGSSMEDVIFSGSDDHTPAGMAEVSMVLENDGGPFPAKYLSHSEIMVTRRLHRSGESEYLINREPARLRDIQEIFMDTGAGAKGFSIIEQGAIGKIITAKPEDRRSLIEEAAGVTKFKARKRESQRKLESTDQNLIRLNDIVIELRRQLESVQRQAQRAERYKKLKDQAQDLDLWLTSKEYTELSAVLEDARLFFSETQNVDISSENELLQWQSKLEVLKASQAERETNLNDQQVQNAKLLETAKELDRFVTELRYKIEQSVKSEEMTGSLLAEAEKRLEILLKEKADCAQQLTMIEAAAIELNQAHGEKKSYLQDIQIGLQEKDEELSEQRKRLMEATEALSHATAKAGSLEMQSSDISARFANLQEILKELEGKRVDFEKRRRRLADDLEKEKQMQFDIMRDVTGIEEHKRDLAAKLEEKRVEVETYKDRLNEVASRLYGLENLHSNFEGFQEGVKNIMLWQKRNSEAHADGSVSQSSQFLPFAEVVEVQPGFEVAMEAALGSRLQTLLGESSAGALAAVGYLKEQSTGRSSFFADDLAPLGERADSAPSGEGVVALLKDVVHVPAQFQKQATFLLDSVVVVDSIGTALKFRPEFLHCTYVTRDGDVLGKDGILTGGAEESADSGVLKRKREIKELSQRKDEWAGKLSLAQAAAKKLDMQLKTAESELEKARDESNRKDIVLAELKKDLERAETELTHAGLALHKQKTEVDALAVQIEAQNLTLTELQQRCVFLKDEKTKLAASIESLEFELQSQRLSISDLSSETTRLQIESVSKTQELEGWRRQSEMIAKSLRETEEQLGRMSVESSKNSQALTSNQVLIEEKKVELSIAISQIQTSERLLREYQDAYNVMQADIRTTEESINTALRQKSERQTRMNESRLKLDQATMKIQNLQLQVQEKYMLEISSIASQYAHREGDVEEAKKELEDLKGKMGRIGDVNLSAIQECSEIETRYNFLSQQQQDLIEAKDQLRKVIERINRICSKRFKETFEAVNERFSKVFPVLFGGGEAQLILIEDPESDEMGIEIVAKPPGKKMANVSLMSGGEKALTAVSLIFSIFLVKPSPYCLLDEVDAPLDDANVSRFNDLVKEMAKRSQIIIVTHNKYTMAVNKKLYGVTMEEKGVSKMVSVSLEDVDKVAEKLLGA